MHRAGRWYLSAYRTDELTTRYRLASCTRRTWFFVLLVTGARFVHTRCEQSRSACVDAQDGVRRACVCVSACVRVYISDDEIRLYRHDLMTQARWRHYVESD